ncbi:hypothetical protein BH24GEM2_BH24GEM2_00680 [soil metagenome]
MRHVSLLAPLSLFLLLHAPLEAQQPRQEQKQEQRGFLVTVGRAVRAVSDFTTRLSMAGSTEIDLERAGLSTVAVGPATFGISAAEVRDTVGARLHAYLHNPTAQPITLPFPQTDWFILVDTRGRRIPAAEALKVEGILGEGSQITIPALERTRLSILFDGPEADARLASLKVGALGIIDKIPVHTAAAPPPPNTSTEAARAVGSGNVWTDPSAAGRVTPAPGSKPDTTGLLRDR